MDVVAEGPCCVWSRCVLPLQIYDDSNGATSTGQRPAAVFCYHGFALKAA